MTEQEQTYEGQCYCGAVKITVTGDAEGAGYCHCKACRSWSAGPVNAFTLWKAEAVTVTRARIRSASTTRTSAATASGAQPAAATS